MLGDVVKEYRCKKKMSRADLSRISGVSYRAIEFIENGETDNPTLKTLEAIAGALEITVEDLIKRKKGTF